MEKLREWDGSFPRYTARDAPMGIPSGSIKPIAMPIIASRASGKSYLLRDLWIRNKMEARFDIVMCWSRTLPNGYLRSFMGPSTCYYDEYDGNTLRGLSDEVDQYRQKHGVYPAVLCVFDDYNEKSTLYCPEIAALFTRGRHRNMSIIYISQLSQSLPSYWRVNSTHCLLLKQKGLGLQSAVNNYMLDMIDDTDSEHLMGKPCRADIAAMNVAKDVLYRRYHVLVLLYETDGSLSESMMTYVAK